MQSHNQKLLQCNIQGCTSEPMSERSLKRHIRQKHPNPDDTPYSCRCRYTTPRKDLLLRHLRLCRINWWLSGIITLRVFWCASLLLRLLRSGLWLCGRPVLLICPFLVDILCFGHTSAPLGRLLLRVSRRARGEDHSGPSLDDLSRILVIWGGFFLSFILCSDEWLWSVFSWYPLLFASRLGFAALFPLLYVSVFVARLEKGDKTPKKN